MTECILTKLLVLELKKNVLNFLSYLSVFDFDLISSRPYQERASLGLVSAVPRAKALESLFISEFASVT